MKHFANIGWYWESTNRLIAASMQKKDFAAEAERLRAKCPSWITPETLVRFDYFVENMKRRV